MTHALATALPIAPATLSLGAGRRPAAVGDSRSLAASTAFYTVGALELLFVGLLVPLTILAVGTPIALVARGVIALLTWLL